MIEKDPEKPKLKVVHKQAKAPQVIYELPKDDPRSDKYTIDVAGSKEFDKAVGDALRKGKFKKK